MSKRRKLQSSVNPDMAALPEEWPFGSTMMPQRTNGGRDRQTIYATFYLRILQEIACARFEWKGMPKEIDTRYVELMLFRQALVGFMWDDQYDRYFCLRASSAGRWNMYDNPVALTLTGNGMVTKVNVPTFPTPETLGCVPIWANTLRTPDWDIVTLAATKLADLERTIEISLQTIRQPYFIAAEDTERLTVMNMFRQLQEGELAVFGTRSLMEKLEDTIKTFPLGIAQDYHLPGELIRDKQMIWAETMTFLGVNNIPQEKAAHVLEDEVNANNAQIQAVRTSALRARQYAAEQINDRFGLNVSVDWSNQIDYGDVGALSKEEDQTGDIKTERDSV